MRGFPQNHQIGIASPLAVMNRIRRQAARRAFSSMLFVTDGDMGVALINY